MTKLPSLVPAMLCGIAFGLIHVPAASAQGSDSCTTPTVVTGQGTFPFNNAAATQGAEGQGYAQCQAFGSTTINHDVWFTWTGTTTGTFTLTLCGFTTVDTKVAVYDGAGCPTAPPLACNDDSCGFRSQLTFPVVAGNAYTIQLGTYPTANGGSGSFSIAPGGTTCSLGTGPDVIVGDVSDVANYTTQSGLDAISLGTTSCNIGSQNLSWIAQNNLHPVIGGALYRHRVVDGSGRFEQIGMS